MIKIYTYINKLARESVVVDNEAFFGMNISARGLSNRSLEVMREIDRAELLDRRTGKIETPYGICGLEGLSTGCKTILNYIHITENRDKYKKVKAINATECGWNALDNLFRQLDTDNSDIIIVLEHTDDIELCEDRECLVNNKFRVTKIGDIATCM